MVTVEDGVLVTAVEDMSKLLSEGFNGSLHVGLLGIDVKNAVFITCVSHNILGSL